MLTYHEQTIARLSPGHDPPLPGGFDGWLEHFRKFKGRNRLAVPGLLRLGTCNSAGSFTEIAGNVNAPTFENSSVARGLWRYKVTALVSGQESAPTQITVSALSSEHSGSFIRRTHQ